MTTAVQNLIHSFEALADADKHEAIVEILRRVPATEDGSLDEMLTGTADELFQSLDAEEAPNAEH